MDRPLWIVVAAAILSVIGQVLLSKGMTSVGPLGGAEMRQIGPTLVRVFSQPAVVVGLATYVLSALCYMIALSRTELSVAYPIVGISYLVIAFVAQFVLHEDVTALRWAGVAVITLGVLIVARSY